MRERKHRAQVTITLVVENLELLDRGKVDDVVKVVLDSVPLHAAFEDSAERGSICVWGILGTLIRRSPSRCTTSVTRSTSSKRGCIATTRSSSISPRTLTPWW